MLFGESKMNRSNVLKTSCLACGLPLIISALMPVNSIAEGTANPPFPVMGPIFARDNPVSDIEKLENKLLFLQNQTWGKGTNIEFTKKRIQKLKAWPDQEKSEDTLFLINSVTDYLDKGGDPAKLLIAYTKALQAIGFALERHVNMRNEEIGKLEKEISEYQQLVDKRQEETKKTINELLNSESWADLKKAYESKKKAREEKATKTADTKPTVVSKSFTATCIFMSKSKQGVEIGRRQVSSTTEEGLASLLKQQCETDHFNVIIKYQ